MADSMDSSCNNMTIIEKSKEEVGTAARKEEFSDEDHLLNKKDTEVINSDKFKLQTRRQSKNITYFNRLKPNVQIEVGTLEDWFNLRI